MIKLIVLVQLLVRCSAIFNLIEQLCLVGLFESPRYDTDGWDNLPFDYVIVGAGTAGSVLANRLSERARVRVLLLEAGGDPPCISEVPFFTLALQRTSYDWMYTVEPQDNFALGMVGRRVLFPRGKVLGGSSTINMMLHVRGNRHDYDRWAAAGNPGWSYHDILPYFVKSENSSVRVADVEYRGTRGYLNVQDPSYRSRSSEVFVRAAKQLGYPYVDYNGANQMGVSYMQVTLREGRRCGAEKAFLRTARGRPNLVVRKNCHVTKVLIDPTTKMAYGVEYLSEGRSYVANASREVILSAGAINSPQLLMLSGVGPRKHLRRMGVDLVHALPVGTKLYDHVFTIGLPFEVDRKIVSNFDDLLTIESIRKYIENSTGPLTSVNFVEAILFMKTEAATHTENYPDVSLLFSSMSAHSDKSMMYKYATGFADDFYAKVFAPDSAEHTFTILPMLLHPKSFGSVRLNSKNPFDHVRIRANYLSDPNGQDVRALIAAIRVAQRIVNAPALRKYRARQVKNVVPGCVRHPYDSDAYWQCALRHFSTTAYHLTSTCKMGPVHNPEAVVDHALRVHGIRRLRVVDASVIPIPLSGNTNAPVFALAEKASDLILEDY